MQRVKQKTKTGWLILILMIILTACGASTTTGNSVENPLLNQDSSAMDLLQPTKEGETTANDDKPATTNPAETVTPTANAQPFDEDAEYDANGIQVGFTAEGRPYKGNPNAPIIIEEFSDYQCPFCNRFVVETLPSLLENQIANGEAVLIFYDFPLNSIHPLATPAANAARCAGEEGAVAYWNMHDELFGNFSQWSSSGNADGFFLTYAENIGLDIESFNECISNNKYIERIEDDLQVGQQRGISSTPSFLVNDQPLIGAQPLSVFNQAITTIQNGGTLASAQPTAVPQPGIAPTPAAISDEFAGAIGNPNAAVTIVEYTDYQCPFCQRHSQETLPQLKALAESGRIYYILKDFPLDNIHPDARQGAVAARCAGEQEAYWEMHDAIYDSQSRWAGQGSGAIAVFAQIAADIGLDETAFATCQTSGKYDTAVQGNLDEGVSLGVQGTPHFFINGFPVSGAQPYDLFEYAIELAESGELANAYVQNAPEPTPAPSGPVDIDITDSYAIGDPGAPVTIIEYTDFECPFCSRHAEQTFPQIKENYVDTGLVYYVFKDFPLTSIHPRAVDAAIAARCAGDQDAYTEMHDQLFARQGQWAGLGNADTQFINYADQLGLDTDTFQSCLESREHEATVMADLQEGVQYGVQGTPAFFLNGFSMSGAQPYSTFEQAIESLLTQ